MPLKRKKTKSKIPAAPLDPYWPVVQQQYYNILGLYKQFANELPVMLFNIQEQRGYAYPYREFAADLSERSQVSLAEQYQAACQAGEMVVFIRDNAKRKLVSYSLPIE
jgi:hypothetical protein